MTAKRRLLTISLVLVLAAAAVVLCRGPVALVGVLVAASFGLVAGCVLDTRVDQLLGELAKPDLAAQLANYLAVRQHTLSTAGLTGPDQVTAEAAYVVGEARELQRAVNDLALAWVCGDAAEHVDALMGKVRDEVADTVLAATALAGMLPGQVPVEECITAKTAADKGRG